jgi:hypothetical protein
LTQVSAQGWLYLSRTYKPAAKGLSLCQLLYVLTEGRSRTVIVWLRWLRKPIIEIDLDAQLLHVRYWPKADILIAWANVRFLG